MVARPMSVLLFLHCWKGHLVRIQQLGMMRQYLVKGLILTSSRADCKKFANLIDINKE